MNDKEKIEEAKRLYQTANADQRYVLESLFPELKESEDERIRKEILEFVTIVADSKSNKMEWIAWLEKQGQEPKKVSIWKHWKDGITGNGEGEPIFLIKVGNTYSLSSVLGFECDYIELAELDKLMREEKQCEQKPTLRERYENIGKSEWFKKTHEGMSVSVEDEEQKWTEEDDYNVQCCIAKAERDIENGYPGRNKELIDWLKSLKQRMEEQR